MIFPIGLIVGLVIGTPLGFILCTMLTANNHADDCHICSFSRQNDELRASARGVRRLRGLHHRREARSAQRVRTEDVVTARIDDDFFKMQRHAAKSGDKVTIAVRRGALEDPFTKAVFDEIEGALERNPDMKTDQEGPVTTQTEMFERTADDHIRKARGALQDIVDRCERAVESAGNKLDEAQKDLDEFDRGVAMLRKIATDNAGADPATGEVD